MGLLDIVHEQYVYGRRLRVLARELAALFPEGARVVDIGCGDGCLDRLILEARPDLGITGLDVVLRPHPAIPVTVFDGQRLPLGEGAADTVMFVDVLHHTGDPMGLLREAHRVARKSILIKDHFADGILSRPLLRFMDWVGNSRHGVALPYNYWSRRQWQRAIADLDPNETVWKTDFRLYAKPATWVFDRSLHFIAKIDFTT